MLLCIALTVGLSLGATAEGGAQIDAATVKKAKEAFSRGQQLYKQARYAEAIAKFEEAYALRPHPVIYFNVGKCHEQLGDTAKALRAYRDYLRLLPDAKDRDTVTDAIANLERRLKEKGLGQLMVFSDPAEATIEVDGKVLGGSPASVELTAGNHKLSVKAEGYEPAERSFVMQTQRSTEITISLRKQGREAAAPAVVLLPAPAPVAAAEAAPQPPPTPPPAVTAEQPRGASRRFTWVAVAGAGVGLGAGVLFGVLASSAAGQLTSQKHDQAEATALQNRALGFALAANVSYVVAGAAAVAAVVLFFVEGRSAAAVSLLAPGAGVPAFSF